MSYLELFLEHALQEGGVLPVAAVPDPGPVGLEHLQQVEVARQVREAAVVPVALRPRLGAQQEGACAEQITFIVKCCRKDEKIRASIFLFQLYNN